MSPTAARSACASCRNRRSTASCVHESCSATAAAAASALISDAGRPLADNTAECGPLSSSSAPLPPLLPRAGARCGCRPSVGGTMTGNTWRVVDAECSRSLPSSADSTLPLRDGGATSAPPKCGPGGVDAAAPPSSRRAIAVVAATDAAGLDGSAGDSCEGSGSHPWACQHVCVWGGGRMDMDGGSDGQNRSHLLKPMPFHAPHPPSQPAACPSTARPAAPLHEPCPLSTPHTHRPNQQHVPPLRVLQRPSTSPVHTPHPTPHTHRPSGQHVPPLRVQQRPAALQQRQGHRKERAAGGMRAQLLPQTFRARHAAASTAGRSCRQHRRVARAHRLGGRRVHHLEGDTDSLRRESAASATVSQLDRWLVARGRAGKQRSGSPVVQLAGWLVVRGRAARRRSRGTAAESQVQQQHSGSRPHRRRPQRRRASAGSGVGHARGRCVRPRRERR
eukprot:366240-Chlamydomonas_euryale.AAC.10